jgi:hypothetical protein
MVHLATAKVDRGPVLGYFTVALDDDLLAPLWARFEEKREKTSFTEIMSTEGEQEELFSAIRERQFVREAPLLILTLSRLISGECRVFAQDGSREASYSEEGACLTAEIEEYLQEHRRG